MNPAVDIPTISTTQKAVNRVRLYVTECQANSIFPPQSRRKLHNLIKIKGQYVDTFKDAFYVKNIITFLTINGKAEEAANFYVSIFKNSKITNILRCGADGPGPDVTWQVTPVKLLEMVSASDKEKAARAFRSMSSMVKLNIDEIE